MTKKTADIVKVGAELTAGAFFGPNGTAAVKILGRVTDAITEHVRTRRETRAKVFADHFMGSGYPHETAASLVEAEMRKAPDATKDAVVAALRELDETISNLAIPALALLARDYLRAARPKDRFFVSALRLFRDLEDSEFEDLRGLVLALTEVLAARPGDLFIGKASWPDKIVLWIPPDAELPWRQSYESLLRTLTVVGFAEIPTGWSALSLPGAQMYGEWKIQHESWSRLGALLKHDSSALKG